MPLTPQELKQIAETMRETMGEVITEKVQPMVQEAAREAAISAFAVRSHAHSMAIKQGLENSPRKAPPRQNLEAHVPFLAFVVSDLISKNDSPPSMRQITHRIKHRFEDAEDRQELVALACRMQVLKGKPRSGLEVANGAPIRYLLGEKGEDFVQKEVKAQEAREAARAALKQAADDAVAAETTSDAAEQGSAATDDDSSEMQVTASPDDDAA